MRKHSHSRKRKSTNRTILRKRKSSRRHTTVYTTFGIPKKHWNVAKHVFKYEGYDLSSIPLHVYHTVEDVLSTTPSSPMMLTLTKSKNRIKKAFAAVYSVAAENNGV